MIADKTISISEEKEMIANMYINGLVINNTDRTGVTHVPVSVFPSPV